MKWTNLYQRWLRVGGGDATVGFGVAGFLLAVLLAGDVVGFIGHFGEATLK